MCVTGNAGIGKSAFGCYVLWRAVRAGRAVVYVSAKEARASIIHAGGVCVESCFRSEYLLRSEALLSDPSTVFICDAVEAPAVNAFTVLISPPQLEMWKRFDDLDFSTRLFFPVASRREIADMLHSCFPHLLASGSEDAVWERFDAIGGIPRFVLDRVNEDLRAHLRGGISRILIERLEEVIGEATIESDRVISHRVVHIKTVGEVAAAALEPADATVPHIAFEGASNITSYAPARTELASALAAELVDAHVARARARAARANVERARASPARARARARRLVTARARAWRP
jgi:hypothetical protein